MKELKNSEALFKSASEIFPGGVNSPVRAFQSVGGHPLFFKSGKGSKINDEDGNAYIDYVCSWGPLLLGHSHPAIVAAIKSAAEKGTGFGAPSVNETDLALLVREAFPSMELMRFVNSGTEAVMGALRTARGFTKRNKIIKFSGCYHGHSDFLLAEAGSGVATLGLPGSAGIPESAVKDTIVIPYNDIEFVKKIFEQYPGEIAAVIIEPVAGNMGVVLPEKLYLEKLRDITSQYSSLLIFDEVMTGFRNTFGGVQNIFNIKPDLTCLAKILGGGLPAGAYGGRKEIMNMVAPNGPVYQAGTLSGNPVVMAAGIAALSELKNNPSLYESLEKRSSTLAAELKNLIKQNNIPAIINRFGSMLTLFFTEHPVKDYDSAKKSDTKAFAKFFWAMIHEGIYLPPSQFESWFVSCAHTDEDIEETLHAASKALKAL